MIRTRFNENERLNRKTNKKDIIQEDINTTKKVLEIIKNIFMDDSSYNLDENIYIQITTIDGIIHNVLFNEFTKIYDEVIQYNNMIILLSEISKMKVIIDNSIDYDIKNKMIDEINSKIIGNYNDKGIEKYIKNNSEKISNIGYEGILENNSMDVDLIDVKLETVLNSKTDIGVKKNTVINKANIKFEKNSVVSEVITDKVNVIQEIEIKEKNVLTDNAKTIEVAKPIQAVDIEVITDLSIDSDSIITKQVPLNVIEDIKENKLEAIIDIKPNLLDGVIGNIDKEKQIVEVKNLQIARLEPINEYVDYEEINKKPLRLDPTGEGYIGVVLEDGTFEPLRVSVMNINVLPDKTANVLANLDSNSQLTNVVRNIDTIDKKLFVESLDITSSENAVKYQDDNTKKIEDIISFSTKKISSITNKEDTAYVVTTDEVDSINTINSIQEIEINQFRDVNSIPVLESAELITKQTEVVEDINLSKETSDVLKDLSIHSEIMNSVNEESVDGRVVGIGSGIILVKDTNLDTTLYFTSKINSIS